MKISHVLKKAGLYDVAANFVDLLGNCGVRIKCKIYQKRVAKYRHSLQGEFKPRVLVIMNAGGIGNVVEATPLVQAIRSFWPKSIITILSLPGDMLENWCIVDHTVFSIDQLKGDRFDHAFLPCWSWSHDEYLRLVDTCEIDMFHKVKLAYNKIFLKPERQYALDLIRALGYKGCDPLYVSIKKPAIELPLTSLRICFVPGGKAEDRWKYKKWPYYSDLAEKLSLKHPEAQILLLGTQDDYVSDEIHSNPNVLDLRGKLSLAETAWMLKQSDIAVGNDCGPMHIADAVQTRALVIFGPTCELKNGPIYKSSVITSEQDCRPCQFYQDINNCTNPTCINKISCDVVLNNIEQIIKKDFPA